MREFAGRYRLCCPGWLSPPRPAREHAYLNGADPTPRAKAARLPVDTAGRGNE
jgi:hypothetical protein